MCRCPEVAPQYDDVFLFEIQGDIDVGLLAAAMDDLVERHSVLRTFIVPTDSGHVQSVRRSRRQVLADGSGSFGVDTLADALLAQRRGTAEIVNGAPLFQAQIHPVEAGWVLAVIVHHLICDEWTMAILWRDLSECYAARLQGRDPRLPPLPTTYADYARSQRAAWPTAAARAVPFWKKVLAGYQDGFAWPQPRNTSTLPSTEVRFAPFLFPADRYPSIRELSRSCRATPFLVLLSATAVAASRVTGRTDLLFATDTASRESPAVRNLMGFFVNTRMTRVEVAKARSFGDVVAAVRASWLAAERYRDCHIHPVMQVLGEPNSMRVDMVYGLLEDQPGPRFADAEIRPLPVTPTYHYWRDLGFQWYPTADGFRADVIHKPSRIDPATLAAVVDEVSAVLERPQI
ncbi:condensation domain-containing protein [Streptomyces sp. NPDC006265]|uniref:condensation domain-containing protein n=1 Tax=Streptomyces sp. NPDC006265 TaxID=3156740 RepID=UPI0033A93CBD